MESVSKLTDPASPCEKAGLCNHAPNKRVGSHACHVNKKSFSWATVLYHGMLRVRVAQTPAAAADDEHS